MKWPWQLFTQRHRAIDQSLTMVVESKGSLFEQLVQAEVEARLKAQRMNSEKADSSWLCKEVSRHNT
jgi:hypothetical protein